MRFLVDQPISWEVAEFLKSLGHDAMHVRDLGMQAAEDAAILARAAAENRIIITQDTDYGTLLVTGRLSRPSVILFRIRDGKPPTQIRILRACLSEVEPDLEAGAIIVIGESTIRVRKLG